MEQNVDILPREGYLEVRFLGAFSVMRFNRQVDAAVQACRERGLELLLVDFIPVQGLPTTLDDYEVSEYASRVAGSLKISCVGTAEQLGEKFGRMVARNRGLNVEVFVERDEATQWLLRDGP